MICSVVFLNFILVPSQSVDNGNLIIHWWNVIFIVILWFSGWSDSSSHCCFCWSPGHCGGSAGPRMWCQHPGLCKFVLTTFLQITNLPLDWTHSAAESSCRRAPGYCESSPESGRQSGSPGRVARQHCSPRGELERVQSDSVHVVRVEGECVHEEQRRLHSTPPQLSEWSQPVLPGPPPAWVQTWCQEQCEWLIMKDN